MGATHVAVRLSSLDEQGTPFEASFLVDTGAVDCVAPGDQLTAAGIRREKRRIYELADGSPVEFDCGFARVSFMGEETVAQVVFGPPGVEPILGVVALENVGVVVDPVTNTLKRLHAISLK